MERLGSAPQRFEGKVALVTGGTSGIGRAAAELFAARGAAVIVAGRRADKGRAVEEGIRAAGGTATFIQTDVQHPTSITSMFEAAIERYGRVDCAFNNAGIAGQNFKDVTEQAEDSWDAVINTNLRGVWLCMKHELRHMRERGNGAIVNSASIYAHSGSDFGIAPYVASKHGVVGLTRAAAVEFAGHGIRVNAVSPGITSSEMTAPAMAAVPQEFEAHIRQRVPLGRIAEPAEIAKAVLWLCSDEASFVTGETLLVDGGWLAR
jgi:NAD(P)-dependent dehydrogenase (short-subunit alcohol dehydrogenase family)